MRRTTPKRALRAARPRSLLGARARAGRVGRGSVGRDCGSIRQPPRCCSLPTGTTRCSSCWSVLDGDGELNVVNVFAGLPAAGARDRGRRSPGSADSRERAPARVARGRSARWPAPDARRVQPGAAGSPDSARTRRRRARAARRRAGRARCRAHRACTRRPASAPTPITCSRAATRARCCASGMPGDPVRRAAVLRLSRWPTWVDGRGRRRTETSMPTGRRSSARCRRCPRFALAA